MAYMTMKTLRQAILENIKWSFTIYVYKYMRLTCVCVISCILTSISIIYCLIMAPS